MRHRVATAPTFVLDRALDFLRGFPPCRGEYRIDGGVLRGAFAVGDRAVAYAVSAGAPGTIVVETADARVVPMVAAFLGTDDDLRRFYARAAGDVAAYRDLVAAHHGLHHVRFATLEEVTVHAVLAQRTPIELAGRYKRAVAAALGPRIDADGAPLIAFPRFAALVPLESEDWQAIVGHPTKARRLPAVVRGVAALGEAWLREAPYHDAVRALCAIEGVGPFTAAMILLRGLGRMDDVPLDLPGIVGPARAVYGAAFDPDRIRARYGLDLGYWAYYLKVGSERVISRRSRSRMNGGIGASARSARIASRGTRAAATLPGRM